MNKLYYNDQSYIAESFRLAEDFTEQNARLAFFKINSFKLSLIKSSFCKTSEELIENLRNSLFNFTSPEIILADQGFFSAETEN
jgi:hypothetical protein